MGGAARRPTSRVVPAPVSCFDFFLSVLHTEMRCQVLPREAEVARSVD